MAKEAVSKTFTARRYSYTVGGPLPQWAVHDKKTLEVVAYADTETEALEAKRAFENVLLPRFTRDEAIAIVRKAVGHDHNPAFTRGLRAALEALAAAGVFVIEQGPGQAHMRDLLDAAGIQ